MLDNTCQVIEADAVDFELQEWTNSLHYVVSNFGLKRAEFILQQLILLLSQKANSLNIYNTPVTNTIPLAKQAVLADNTDLLQKASNLVKWNALAMVAGAAKKHDGLGGHIATYASSCVLYDVGFNYFFKGRSSSYLEDLVFVQGHAAPGIYARALLEGRLTIEQVSNFRQECGGNGVSSYPHPWLMPDFWQFPTVSMGLGPLSAVYHARFIKYLIGREMLADTQRKVWAFCGDGETDEPETLSALSFASYEGLDNLIFVINCNLQRLDGLVRSSGSIVKELEAKFAATGWRVIKVLFNSAWDQLFAKDKQGILMQAFANCIDGQMQRFSHGGGSVLRKEFFDQSPQLQALIDGMSDADLDELSWGGHDFKKVYSAFHAAVDKQAVPTVILVQTTKGNGVPKTAGINAAHNVKKLDKDSLVAYAQQHKLPISDDCAEKCKLVTAQESDEVHQYLLDKRQALGGFLPLRYSGCAKLPVPEIDYFASVFTGTGARQVSSTMAFVRVLSMLLKFDGLSKHVVPIVADESRTFGMEGLFRQIGIYNRHGQNYEPVDKSQLMYYRESKSGQLLQEGINEAGATSSWLAAATSYSHSKVPMVPFYIFYSMFGFQRVADIIWAAADSRARGFLIGATSGRTSLAGEGLQHTDGHSHIFASTVPNCRSYDPTYNYELAVIIQHGLQRMLQDECDEFYYLTVGNDNIEHQPMPDGVASGIVKGMYLLQKIGDGEAEVNLLSCGAVLPEAIKAAEDLFSYKNISVNIWSVTSFNELARDGASCVREDLLLSGSDAEPREPYVSTCLNKNNIPVVAATDYIKAYAEQLRPHIEAEYIVLGTDGFGRSDIRENMRKFFEIDFTMIAYSMCVQLYKTKKLTREDLEKSREHYCINVKKPDPMQC